MVCKTCSHEKPADIDKALVQGVPKTRIGLEYGLSEQSVRQHAKNHLKKAVVKAAERRVEAGAENILTRLESLIADAQRIAEAAVRAEKFAAAQSGIRNVVSILELVARLTGQLGDGSTQVNIALIQQAKAEEGELARLRRLSPSERETLRALLTKMEGSDAIEVEAVRAPEDHDETTAAASGSLGE